MANCKITNIFLAILIWGAMKTHSEEDEFGRAEYAYATDIYWEGLRLGLEGEPLTERLGHIQGFIEIETVNGTVAGCKLWESTDAMTFKMSNRSILMDGSAVDAFVMAVKKKESILGNFDSPDGVLVTIYGKLEVCGRQCNELGVFRGVESVSFDVLKGQRLGFAVKVQEENKETVTTNAGASTLKKRGQKKGAPQK